MKIALVNALDPFAETAGAERTLAQWLGRLHDRGHEIEILTYGDPSNDNSVDFVDSIIRLDDKTPIGFIERYIKTSSIDVVLTRGGWSDIALWATDTHDVPCVLCVMSNFELQVASGIASDAEPDHIIAVSDEFRARAKGVYKWTPATSVHQPIDFEYFGVDDRDPTCYTMINPVSSKGGFVFQSIAQRRPEDPFLAKMGWNHQRNDDLSFNSDIYDIFTRSLNFRVTLPREPDLDAVDNVEFVRHGDIRDIYRRTKILLVPSQWQESFGRVILEAMFNGIPVVASAVGGIPEACGDAGVLVDDYDSVDAWLARIDELEDDEVYEEYVARGRERATDYREQMDDEVERFVDTVLSVA